MSCAVVRWYGPDEVTPVVSCSDGLVAKRDDLVQVGGMRGGKVRTCLALAQGASGLITAGSRHSPQVAIVAAVAAHLGVECRVHVPTGTLAPVVQWAASRGAEIVQHRPGYNTVIKARAREDSFFSGWRLIPFGMECREAVEQTAKQAVNIPPGIHRIVVAVGSGMTLAGILSGIDDVPILGVVVGADPRPRLDAYAPRSWQLRCSLVPAKVGYSKSVAGGLQTVDGYVDLDPHYEAKCLPFLRPGDLFWVVGHRAAASISNS